MSPIKYAAVFASMTLFANALSACSDDENGSEVSGGASSGGSSASGGSSGSGGTIASGGSGTTGGSSSTSGGSGVIPSEACEGLPLEDDGSGGDSGEACTGVSLEAERVDVDVFVMMDRSQSMGFTVEGTDLTRWEALRAAVEQFTQASENSNIRLGIGFFSRSGVSNNDLDCDAADYAHPSVGIGPLEEVSGDVLDAIDEIRPGGLTPTVPALTGAIDYARNWSAENPGRATLVVLVTDGYPTQCSTDPAAIASAAKAGYESDARVRTFVIGVGEVAKFNLDNYARAGGTHAAYLTEDGDITNTFVNALNNVTNSEIACEYQLPEPPDGKKLDTEKVQVVYTPAAGDAEEVPRINSLAACASNPNGGWYYDNPGDPSKISVCPCTCARFQAGRVDVRLGCKPRLGLR